MDTQPLKEIIDIEKYNNAETAMGEFTLRNYKVEFFRSIDPFSIQLLKKFSTDDYFILSVRNGLILKYSKYVDGREMMIVVDEINHFVFPVYDSDITIKDIFYKDELTDDVCYCNSFYLLYRAIGFRYANPEFLTIDDNDVKIINKHFTTSIMSWEIKKKVRDWLPTLYKWVLEDVNQACFSYENNGCYFFKIKIGDVVYFLSIPFDNDKKKIEVKLYSKKFGNYVSCEIKLGFFQKLFQKTVENKLGHKSEQLKKEERIIYNLKH